MCTVIDDYSRNILSWRLTPTMSSTDVEQTLDLALEKTGVTEVQVRHRPRLLSDNGPCYVSKQLKEYLGKMEMTHIRSAPYHPQTQGKIERYHRSLKNVVTLDNYYFPGDLELAIGEFVEYYNNQRYHESLDNLTPSDVYHGRGKQILTVRDYIKEKTLKLRRFENLGKGVIGRTKKSLDLAESVS